VPSVISITSHVPPSFHNPDTAPPFDQVRVGETRTSRKNPVFFVSPRTPASRRSSTVSTPATSLLGQPPRHRRKPDLQNRPFFHGGEGLPETHPAYLPRPKESGLIMAKKIVCRYSQRKNRQPDFQMCEGTKPGTLQNLSQDRPTIFPGSCCRGFARKKQGISAILLDEIDNEGFCIGSIINVIDLH
jgi:hypothetical protein